MSAINYITGLYHPVPFYDANGKLRCEGFSQRVSGRIERRLNTALPYLRHSQSVLGNDMTVFMEEGMDVPKGLNVRSITLPNKGIFQGKWHIMLHAMEQLGTPVLWMDMLDSVVMERFTPTEESFLLRAQDDIIIQEWCVWKIRGEIVHIAHRKDGSEVPRKLLMPQNAIMLIKSDRMIRAALATKVDMDQPALALAYETTHGIYQDTPIDEVLKFSSRGLFKAVADRYGDVVVTNKQNLFKTKIFHQPEFQV
jgi:hypothetical protein